jgi:flagellar protein FlaJ
MQASNVKEVHSSGKFSNLFRSITYWAHKFKSLPFVLIGDWIKSRKDAFEPLHLQMRQARIPLSYELYISNAIFYSIITAIIGAIVGVLLSYLIIHIVGLPPALTHLRIRPEMAWLLEYREITIAFLITAFLTLLLGGVTFLLFYIYPSFKASERKGNIDKNLPYAVTFMYALSRGGMNIIEVLRALADSKDTYGAVSEEADAIIRDMEYFGNDLRTALHNIIKITPSEKFQDLIHNLLTVIDSGGDIPAYFRDKSEQFLQQEKIEQKGFLETLGLIAESYVTAFVAGPLFIIILGVMMNVMGSGTQSMLYAIIYAVIPIGSIMFVVMISIITPGVTGAVPLLPENRLLKKDFTIPENLSEEEKTLFEKFIKSRKALELKKTLKHPLKPVKEKPMYILIVSVPAALIFLTLSLFQAKTAPDLIDFLDNRLIFTFYIIVIPLTLFHEYKERRDRKLQSQIPDFLKKLASTNETGMTLRESIYLLTKAQIGNLAAEIRKMWNDIQWGLSVNEALTRFANRIRTHIVARAITLLTKANESSGDIGEVLLVAARDAAAEQELKRERTINMLIYIVIIYISFLVFIGIIYIISTTFLAEMVKAGTSTTGGSVPLSINPNTLNVFNRAFFHAAAIQGICSGLIAGVMGEGNVISGLKHSLIMLTIAYLMFTLFVL